MAGVTMWLDEARWREHQRTVAGSVPLVPVAKGNGYGFSLPRLAAEAQALSAASPGAEAVRSGAIAVGTPAEVAQVRDAFDGDIVILQPYDGADPLATSLAGDRRVISTVSRVGDLERITTAADEPRVLVEVLTSMRRHGLPADRLAVVRDYQPRIRFEGWTIHLPIRDQGRYAEAESLGRAALSAAPGPLWLSHLPAEEVVALGRQLGGSGGAPTPVRLRQGTRLWLGDPGAYRVTATVLDVHSVRRGERAGYRQRRVPADGWIVVVAGGTAQGIGLEAPTSARSMRARAISVATGSLEAAGLALSPYTLAGKKRWFLEPPHMQSSLVFLPRSVSPPAVGDEVPVEVRLTTAVVDRIVAV
ncbi:alanine racemase [Microlunatus ginsengisoli]|uniref:Alanine racemase n=1 Tax=Microlunatus ginsengisoli TaxID=363863 RepID=A0ABP7ADB9_9ACTN